jgi:hypothetical protein
MRSMTKAIVAILAVLALTALSATSAMALPQFLKNIPDTFKGKGVGGELLNLNKEAIKCTNYEVTGTIATEISGEITVDFTGCTALGFKANTLGDPEGTILVKAPFETCYVAESKEKAGIKITLPAPLHIEVPAVGVLISVLGSIAATITPLTETKNYVINFEGTAAGDPSITKCDGEVSLLSAVDTKTEVSTRINQKVEIETKLAHTIDELK